MGATAAQHETRSSLEAAVCETMRRQNLPHEHRSLRFRVQMTDGALAEFRPDIVARRGPILFLVVPLPDVGDAARLQLLSHFLAQHSPEIVLVLLAKKEAIPGIPAEAYDELYDSADVAAVVRRIRLQEPTGILRPFPKPRSGAGL